LGKDSTNYNKYNQTIKNKFPHELCISSLKIQIFRLKIYISNLEMHIFRLKIQKQPRQRSKTLSDC